MGSTLAAVHFADSTFVAANVGDSPIYLIHEGDIEMLSVPHTLLAEQAELGSEKSVFAPELQHVLTRGMGAEDNVQPDICEAPCFNGDRLVLCSDGLSGKVTPGEILAAVARQSPSDACRFLVDTANRRGGEDNITVIVLLVEKQKRLVTHLRRWMARFSGDSPLET
jgi:protein phosphatase